MTRVSEEREDILRGAKAQAQKIADDAMEQAETRRVEMVEKAKHEVELVISQGKTQLNTERENMIREARKELIEIAVSATKRIIGEEINEKKATSLAEEVVRKMT